MSARFLVVEDDEAFAENLLELLDDANLESAHARTAAQARTLLAERSFDAALIDLSLPDAHGGELLAELRARSPRLLAIVLTGQPTVASAREAIRVGASAYLLKDGDPRELEQVIRRTAEQASLSRALAESESRYTVLVERAPLGIALVRDGRYTFANERFGRIFAVDPRSLIGAPVENVYHSDERERVRGEWRLDEQTWEDTSSSKGVRRADGQRIDIHVTRARLALEGGTAVQLIVRDTTEENRLARELDEAREQLEDKRRLAALGEMVAGIAHEIRNPLQGVTWGLNEIRSVCARSNEPTAKEALEKIAASTREIEAIVAEVLDYARPMRLERLAFGAQDLLESAREDLAAQADAAGVTLSVDPKGAGFEAWLDPLKIKQALVNLGRNAIEASSRGGRVTLRAARAECPTVCFEVQDEGTGIPEGLREKVFVPFVTTKVKGTGLGLAVVRRIVEAHGGVVRLEPRQPHGTVARLELPAA